MKDPSCARKIKSYFLRGKEKQEGIISHRVYKNVLTRSQPHNLDMKLPDES